MHCPQRHARTQACLPSALWSTVLLGPVSKRLGGIRNWYLERIWSSSHVGRKEGKGREKKSEGKMEGEGKLHVSDLDMPRSKTGGTHPQM